MVPNVVRFTIAVEVADATTHLLFSISQVRLSNPLMFLVTMTGYRRQLIHRELLVGVAVGNVFVPYMVYNLAITMNE